MSVLHLHFNIMAFSKGHLGKWQLWWMVWRIKCMSSSWGSLICSVQNRGVWREALWWPTVCHEGTRVAMLISASGQVRLGVWKRFFTRGWWAQPQAAEVPSNSGYSMTLLFYDSPISQFSMSVITYLMTLEYIKAQGGKGAVWVFNFLALSRERNSLGVTNVFLLVHVWHE